MESVSVEVMEVGVGKSGRRRAAAKASHFTRCAGGDFQAASSRASSRRRACRSDARGNAMV
jgi:hypothetical protein